MKKKMLYQLFNLNKPFRLLILDKLENGIKGIEFKEENKEVDKRHIEILKNWRKKTKEERMSFINDIGDELDPESFMIVEQKKEHFKQQFKDKLTRNKNKFTNLFKK